MDARVEKVRRAREQRVPVGKHTFVIRRPTDVEVFEHNDASILGVLRYVVGWDGVTEADIINGGDPHPVPFSAELCAEWLSDHVDMLAEITQAVREAYRAHREAQEAAVKN